jgi:hypothetical protein
MTGADFSGCWPVQAGLIPLGVMNPAWLEILLQTTTELDS